MNHKNLASKSDRSEDRLSWLAADPLERLNSLKLGRIAAGHTPLDLSMINPDLPPPRLLMDRLSEATVRPANQRYSVARGIRRLREAFAEKYRRAFGVELNAEKNVCITMGTKDALVNLLLCLTEPGQTVLVGTPTYPVYFSALNAANLTARMFRIDAADPMATLKAISDGLSIGPSPRVLLLNFPNNPTGVTVDAEFVRAVRLLARQHGTIVINDFVYGEMCFNERPAPSFLVEDGDEEVYEIYSLSKAYSIPGWRIAAVLGAKQGVTRLAQLKAHLDYGIYLPLQIASAWGLSAEPSLAHFAASQYRARSATLCSGLTKLGWEPVIIPHAGASVWAKAPLARYGVATTMELAEKLLLTRDVFVLPGEVFGSPGYVRFALVMPEDRLRMVLQRLA